jgi:hypothetical protein
MMFLVQESAAALHLAGASFVALPDARAQTQDRKRLRRGARRPAARPGRGAFPGAAPVPDRARHRPPLPDRQQNP